MLKLLDANSIDLDGWIVWVEAFKVLCHHPGMDISKSPDIQELLGDLEKAGMPNKGLQRTLDDSRR